MADLYGSVSQRLAFENEKSMMEGLCNFRESLCPVTGFMNTYLF